MHMLEHTLGAVTVIGIDRDKDALAAARERLNEYKEHIRFFHADFKDFDEIMKAAGLKRVQKCLFDLGVSSFQIDDPERGFSYSEDGPLDMRMDRENPLRAEHVVNSYSREELVRVFRSYGDERNPGKIADAVITERSRQRIESTQRLAQIFRRASAGRKGTGCPESPLFMALRIEVNRELDAVRSGVEKAIGFLETGGRICVISFHSGEDRIVKRMFKEYESRKELSLVTRRPVTPSVREVRKNPRARSAKMRAAERTGT